MGPLLVLMLLAGAYVALRYTSSLPDTKSVTSIAEQIPLVGEYFLDTNTIQKIAYAIARAEGYYVRGTKPDRNNNPGDLKGNYAGTAIGSDEDGFDVYATPQDGWSALYRQVSLWLTNKSHVAGQETTLYELSRKYTLTQQDEWLHNVSSALGVDESTKLGDISA